MLKRRHPYRAAICYSSYVRGCKNDFAETSAKHTHGGDSFFMAFNIILSSFGIPVPGGHLYLCDVVICLAAILLTPLEAFVVGGIGSFLGSLHCPVRTDTWRMDVSVYKGDLSYLYLL